MYFELQLSASVFTRVVRNRLRSLPLGVDLSEPDPESDGLLVVDQVIIGDTTTIQREQFIDYSNSIPLAKDTATQRVTTFSPTNLGQDQRSRSTPGDSYPLCSRLVRRHSREPEPNGPP